jgi:hypothetical protein
MSGRISSNPTRYLSPPQRLLKDMKFEGIEIALEGIWYEDNC